MAGGKDGGAEMACIDMCIAMHEAGEDIEVITRANAVRVPILEAAGISVHILPFGGKLDVYTPWAIGRIIKKAKPQIVQTWMSRAAKKTPNWRNLKTPDRYLVAARLGGYYKAKNFKHTDFFVPITPDLQKYLIESGFDKQKIQMINNFAETESNIKPIKRSDFDTPDDATVILTLARLHKSKALDVILDALPDMPNTYLWMAGEGPLRTVLEQMAKDNGVADRVRFLGWRTDRAALLQEADICAFISRYEPFGSVFVQAWTNECPVIVSDADGPKQFCTHEQDCLMVEKDDAGQLVNAVQRLQNDTALRDRIVEKGLENYKASFTKEKCVQSYLEWYHENLKEADIL